ncbi:MAG: NAD-dependent epimerase/dehydratase family protein [Candidatus Methylomirabilales bacterium]
MGQSTSDRDPVRVLVTGGTGFIGSHLVKLLLRRGVRLTCLLRPTSPRTWLPPETNIIEGDLTDPRSLRQIAATGFDYVYHLGGLTKSVDPNHYEAVNHLGVKHLAEACAAGPTPPKVFLYLSSLAAAGPSPDGRALTEEDPPRPISRYGRSKLAGEAALQALEASLPWVIVRAPVIYGPRDRALLPFFRLATWRIALAPPGDRTLSLCHVDDLAEGLTKAVLGGKTGQIYYVSDGRLHSWRAVLAAIGEALGVRPVRLPLWPGLLSPLAIIGEAWSHGGGGPAPFLNRDKVEELKAAHWVCDSSKAVREWDYAPRVSLAEGMRRTVAWYREQGWL